MRKPASPSKIKEQILIMIDTAAVLPAIIAFAVSAAAGPILIPILTSLKMDQTDMY